MEELKNFVEKELPINGAWWYFENSSGFVLLAEKLYNNGESIDEIKEQLTTLYHAVANEFGN